MMNEIRQSAPTTLQATFYNDDVAATDTEVGAVTVHVVRGDGTDLLPPGTATAGSNPYTVELDTADTVDLDELTALWTSTNLGALDTRHRIVGRYLVDLADIRSQASLDDAGRFPTAALARVRDEHTRTIEDYLRFALRPVWTREMQAGSGTDRLMLDNRYPRSIRRVTIDGEPADTAEWTLSRSGRVHATVIFPSGAEIVVEYEHGLDRPEPDDRRYALTAIRDMLLSDGTGRPSRVLQETTEFGNTRFSIPSKDRITGIPEVDAHWQRRRQRRVVVG